jgi:hypothetical protein
MSTLPFDETWIACTAFELEHGNLFAPPVSVNAEGERVAIEFTWDGEVRELLWSDGHLTTGEAR